MATPTVRQLQYFLTAARLGTFSAAAAEHHIAQPSLSEQISVLEANLGLRLFTRTTRRLLLTDVGKQLVPLAEKTLADVDEIADFGRRVGSLERARCCSAPSTAPTCTLLTDLIREFHSRHPAVKVKVTGLNSSEVAESVRNGDLEAGIVQLPIDDRQLRLIPGSSSTMSSTCPQSEHTRAPIDIATLSTRPLILSEARWSLDDLSGVAARACAGGRGAPGPDHRGGVPDARPRARGAGVGDSLVSYHVGRSVIAERGLYMAPLTPAVEEHYAFVTRRAGSISRHRRVHGAGSPDPRRSAVPRRRRMTRAQRFASPTARSLSERHSRESRPRPSVDFSRHACARATRRNTPPP
jgi:DNA-binding transcriptional LysR family regulator